MSAVIIDGKQIAADVRADVAKKVAELNKKGIQPCLAVILVGENPASVSYVTGKRKALAEVGMVDRSIEVPESTTEEELLKIIDGLNKDDKVHGILVQLPLPKHINEDKVIMAIDPSKDVDGFHPVSVGNLMIGRPGFLPCTPHGIIVLLQKMGIETSGKHAVVIGRSNIVGKPVSILLARKDVNCTVTMCHTGTKNMAEITRQADIVVVAVGKPKFLDGSLIKDGATVIDVGINRLPDGTLCGDVDFDVASEHAAHITPVPGGVGPMTIATLMQNTVTAYQSHIK